MKGNLICSAGSKEDLERMINKYYYSENYVITNDLRAYNTKTNRYSDNKIVVKRNRWRFELADG